MPAEQAVSCREPATRSRHDGSMTTDTRGRQPEGRRRQDDHGRLHRRGARRARQPGAARRPRPPGLPDLLPRHRPRGPRALGPPRADQGSRPARGHLETDDGVDLLPATIELARAEADLLTRTGREHVIKRRWRTSRTTSHYDWVLLDCPPSLGVLTVAALTAADGVLIPLQCETLSHRGVGQLLDTVHDVRRFTNRGLEVWGVLPTLYDGRTNHARTVLETISRDLRARRGRATDPEDDQFTCAPA